MDPPCQGHAILSLYSPLVLDAYRPHFTLVYPFTGRDNKRMARVLSEMLREFSELTMDSVHPLVQMDEGEPWQIYRDFERQCCPELLDTWANTRERTMSWGPVPISRLSIPGPGHL
jgi:hypothetical protein